MRSTLRVVAACALTWTAACGGDQPAVTAATTASLRADADDPRLFLLPDAPRAVVGRTMRLSLRRGDLGDATPLGHIDESFDPFVARVAGIQHNELVADLAAAGSAGDPPRAGVSHVFERAGDAMVGFSTRPRRVRWGGEEVELAQHVKSLLFVSQGGRDLPQPSAALSHRIGLQLELVPMVDPLPLLPGEFLPVRLRFDGPALAGAEVVVQFVAALGAMAGVAVESFRGDTDAVGAVVVPIGDAGRYLIRAEHRLPATAEKGLARVHLAVLTFDVGAKR